MRVLFNSINGVSRATSAYPASNRVCQLPGFVIFTGSGIKAGTTIFVSSFSGDIIDQSQEILCPCALLQPSCEERREALQTDNCLVHASVLVSLNLYLSLLLGCVNRNDLEEGRRIHAHIVERGLNVSTRLGNSLLDMYAKCGSMQEAEQVFHHINDRNVVTWTMMIVGHSKAGQPEEAFQLFWQMKHEGLQPDEFTMVGILSACAALKTIKRGKEIHSELQNSGLELNVIVGNTLMDMYTKCGNINEAEQVFINMFKRDVISWSTMILGYSQVGLCDKALSYYRSMLDEGMKPNTTALIGTLKACILLEELEAGRIIHISILKSMAKFEVTLGNTLIDMYTKCGCMMDARRVLDRMANQDTVSWNIIISGHTQQTEDDVAFKAYLEMAEQGVRANAVTFTNVLKACANQSSLLQGKWLHACIVRNGLESDLFIGNSLLDMYAKCGSMEDACRLFDRLDKREVVPWNAIIVGHTQHGLGDKALKFLLQMLCEGIIPNDVTFSSVLKGCGSLENLQEASDVFNSMSEQDLVSWNAMITGYAEHGLSAEAFRVFWEMQSKNINLDEVSFLGILKACQSSADLSRGKYIHSLILKSAMKNNALVLNSLVNMYAKCGCLEGARQVFDVLPRRDWVSWTVMITNYIEHENYKEALNIFSELIQEGVDAKEETYVSILRACSSLAALEAGQKIHSQFVESGLNSHLIVEGHLVDMYAKCGSLEDAQNVCVKMSEKDLGSWTKLIVALAQHGNSSQVLWIFDQLLDEGVKLDNVAFLGIFKACSNSGLLHEGCQIFNSMRYDHGITPSSEHCACMVDLLCRLGHLEEAVEFLERIPFQPTSLVWTTLLNACRVHGNVTPAKLVAEQVLELEPENIGALLTLVNIYSTCETLINEPRNEQDYEWQAFLGSAH